jgi:predicted PurR-regulated permease PerM
VALIPIAVIDNVLKPILMARGLPTPLLVILLGVIGGTVAYGLIGLFLGPILLGIFYELVSTWMRVDAPRVGILTETGTVTTKATEAG